jgi:hypothetical protein
MAFIAFILFGIMLVAITVYIIVYHIYPSSGTNDLLPKMTPLSTSQDIMYSDQVMSNILSTGGSTVMGFFKITGNDKTMKIGDSFIPLIQVTNNWALEISPAPDFKSGSSARLRVFTSIPGKRNTEEIITLPPFPQQKWVCVAILRDGRRFDVIYDNQIVGSHRLENYPSVIPSSLSVGSIGLEGSVIHVLTNNVRMTPYAIERLRSTYIDTNGVVLEDNALDVSLPSINIFAKCPPGLPCDPVTRPPPNNLIQWSTPYA